MLDFHRVYWLGSSYISGSNFPEFWICSGNNFKITFNSNFNSNFQGKLLKIRYVQSVYDLKPEFFSQLWTTFISCEFLEIIWEIMRHRRYCLARHPGVSSNITNATHFSTPPTLAHQPPYLCRHTTHVTHVAKSFTLAQQPRNPRSHAIDASTLSTAPTLAEIAGHSSNSIFFCFSFSTDLPLFFHCPFLKHG